MAPVSAAAAGVGALSADAPGTHASANATLAANALHAYLTPTLR